MIDLNDSGSKMRDKSSIASLSSIKSSKKLKTLELFAGGGGMALGAKLAGYNSILALEYEKNSCATGAVA